MTAHDDVRARFEAWMHSVGLGSLLDKPPARHDGSFEYISAGTQHRWLGYRAAHADLTVDVEKVRKVIAELRAVNSPLITTVDERHRFAALLTAALPNANGKEG